MSLSNHPMPEPQPALSAEIRESWRRCIDAYRLDPDADTLPPRLTEAEVLRRGGELEEIFACGAPVIENLRRMARNGNYAFFIADAQGVMVRAYADAAGDDRFRSDVVGLGAVWTESQAGPNGIGTCLASARPLTVHGGEHFGHSLRQFTCSAAPLFWPDGRLIGALDFSSLVHGGKEAQRLALNLIRAAAEQIEAGIFRKLFTADCHIALCRPAETGVAASPALVAVSGAGTILGMTSAACRCLGLADGAVPLGRSVTELLATGLDALLGSPERPSVVPTRDGTALAIAMLPRPLRSPGPFVGGAQPTGRGGAPPPAVAEGPLDRAAGGDLRLRALAATCRRICDTRIGVLLQGETGVGKEVWARAIHAESTRRHRPFVTVDCASIPDTLIESELFGYAPGAFTGAAKGGRTGKIEAAEGGTLFLDEIGDMPLSLQGRLLRVLAEGEVTPIGRVRPVPVDLHVICATHRDLAAAVKAGSFRDDLYYRLNGVRITLLPLRQRDDRAQLIRRLLAELAAPAPPPAVAEPAMWALLAYPWPGNVRQLKAALQYAACLCCDGTIELADLPEEVLAAETPAAPPPAAVVATDPDREDIRRALEQNRWRVTHAARALGVSRATLHRRMKRLGLAGAGLEGQGVKF